MNLHGWSPARTEDGSWTLEHPDHGEACHSRSGAWLEARERYARPCELAARACAVHENGRPLRLLDIGTGLGLNLAAALEAVEGAGASLAAVTLEHDRSVLAATLALGGGAHPGPEERWHAPVRAALCAALERISQSGQVEVSLGARSTLRVLLGDARETLGLLDPGLRFDALFLDPFSPGREPDLWQEPFLAALARRMAPGARLSTYCARYAVRLGLARAGLRVGLGPRVGAKAEGTLASPDLDLPALAPRVERRLRRDLDGPPGAILDQPLRERPPRID